MKSEVNGEGGSCEERMSINVQGVFCQSFPTMDYRYVVLCSVGCGKEVQAGQGVLVHRRIRITNKFISWNRAYLQI